MIWYQSFYYIKYSHKLLMKLFFPDKISCIVIMHTNYFECSKELYILKQRAHYSLLKICYNRKWCLKVLYISLFTVQCWNKILPSSFRIYRIQQQQKCTYTLHTICSKTNCLSSEYRLYMYVIVTKWNTKILMLVSHEIACTT